MIETKKTLKNLTPYFTDEYYADCEMRLNSNENPYPPCPSVIQAIRNFSPDKIRIYPAYGELIDKLAELTGSSSKNFLLTNGCDEAINVVLNAFLEGNDELLTFSPTFSMPKIYCGIIGAKFVEIPYKIKWAFNYDDYAANITDKTKILYLTSPNNPTGELVSVDIIKKLALENKNKLVLLDCTYFNYSEICQNEYYKLIGELENLVIVKSFSKDYALAGLRLGYVFANEKIIYELKKIISPYSVNAVALHAGIAALSEPEYFLDIKNKVNKTKNLLIQALSNFGYKAYNSEANFILCDFGVNSEFIYNKLIKNGILVKRFKNEPELENVFRITAPRFEDIEKFIDLIKPRPLFVFDLDGVVFDVKNSYRMAIKKTFEFFTNSNCSDEAMQSVKNLGGMSNDWDVTAHLIKDAGVCVEYDKMVDVFQNFFYIKGKGGLIDNEENVLSAAFFEELTKYVDCAVFTGRPKEEAFYSLEKYGIKKYFSYFICNEDVEGNFKPSPFGLNKIKKMCPNSKIIYFGDTVDDIKSGKDACVEVFGIIPPNASKVEETKEKLIELGAYGVIETVNPEAILDLAEKRVYANN